MFIRKLEIESSILGSQKRFFDEFEGFFTILLLAQSTPPERAASPRVRRGNSRHQQLSEDEIEKVKQNYQKVIDKKTFSRPYQMRGSASITVTTGLYVAILANEEICRIHPPCPPLFWRAGQGAAEIIAVPIPRRSGEWESRGTSPSGAVRAGPPTA